MINLTPAIGFQPTITALSGFDTVQGLPEASLRVGC